MFLIFGCISGPEAPQDLTVSGEFTDIIEVQWDIPSVLNGMLIKYMLQVTNTETSEIRQETIDEGLQRERIVLNVTWLTSETLYLVRVSW